VDVLYDINDDVKRDVLAATDLVSLIGGTTSLKKMGASWKGLCPFHGEKTPSFYVHPTKGFYYCFGCGAKGDAITFVRETERLDFPEAVAYLARLAGVALPVRKSGSRADRTKETRATEALVAAARFFRAELSRHAGAKKLLEKRGLSPKDAEAYGFGAAPDGWEGLKEALSGFSEDVLLASGLLTRNAETGRIYDRFRNRLTVEIKDSRGEVLGFGARALGDEQPKYLNSPESTRFSKGKLLYGLDRAKEPIRTGGEAVLCEGYFDRIAFERAGLPNAVASMGTALTPQQADLLARHAPVVVVAYDGDEAGRSAAKKAFALFVARGVAVKHLLFPDKDDPDSYLAEKGAEALREAVAKATPLLDALLREIPPAGGDPNERSARISEALEIVNGAPDRLLRYELLSGLSRGTGVPVPVLSGDKGKKPATRAVENAGGNAGGAVAEPELPGAEEKVLSVLLSHWPVSAPLAAGIPPEVFSHPVAREVFTAIRQLDPAGPTLDFSGLQSHVGPGAGLVVARLLLEESGSPVPVNDTEVTGGKHDSAGGKDGTHGLGKLHKPLMQLKIRQLEERGALLLSDIQAAEKAGDSPRRLDLSREKSRLAAEIQRLRAELKRHPKGEGE
jgi:DNA primase